MSSPFYHLQGMLGEDVMLLDATIRESFQNQQPMIPEISRYLINAGGKRVRPFLALGFSKLFNSGDSRRFYHAASLEFLHTATLLHDDIVDDSDQRRGQDSAHKVWGNEAAVLVGDFMFSQAFRMMTKLEDQNILNILAQTATTIAEGEIMQLTRAHDIDMSDADYIAMISGKTSILFEAACHTAALLAGQPTEVAQQCGTYGLNLGIAFQLADDALDYSSVNATLGKNIGDDFNEGKISAPALYSYREGDATIRAFWQRAMQGPRDQDMFIEAQKIIEQQNITAKVLTRAEFYAHRAIAALQSLPEAAIKSTLMDCALYAAKRDY